MFGFGVIIMMCRYLTKYADQIKLNEEFGRLVKNVETVFIGRNTINDQLVDRAKHGRKAKFVEYCDAGIDPDEV